MSTTVHQEAFGTTDNPCPWWCEDERGHGYDCLDDTALMRFHTKTIGSVPRADGLTSLTVELQAAERQVVDEMGSTITIDPILCDAPDAEELSASEARGLAMLLTKAADFVEMVASS